VINIVIETKNINGFIIRNIFPDHSSEEDLLQLAKNVSETLTKILNRKNEGKSSN